MKARDNGGVLYIDPSISYWERLKHQAAIAAMQGMLTSPALLEVVTETQSLTKKEYANKVAYVAEIYANALVEKLKEEEKK